MLDLFQMGVDGSDCGGLLPLVRVLRKGLFPLVQIIIPIGLIIYGTIDLGKAVIASDEKEVKSAQSRLIKRVIYAIVIFLVPALVTLVMNIVAIGADPNETDTTSWASCWNSVYIVNK